MTIPDWKRRMDAIDALCEADPKHESLHAAAVEIRERLNSLRRKTDEKLWRLQRMLRLIDVCQRQGDLAEDAEDEISTGLKAVTGECAECWEGSYRQSANDLRLICFGLCAEIAADSDLLERLGPERDAAFERAAERRQEISKAFDREQEPVS